MKRLFILNAWFGLLLLSAAFTGCGEGGAKSAGSGPPPMPAKVANPVLKTIALTETLTGRFVPVDRVDLQARVSGYVESVHFEEGQQVEEGDLMFQIDPRPFEARLEAAQAEVSQAEARVALAESNRKRAERLVASNAISGEEAEIRVSEFAQAQADLAAAKAAERSAQLDLEFSEVTAPISGIASRFEVTPGNFIMGGAPGSTMLTTIIPHSPIHCIFEVDERQVLEFTRMYFAGKTDGRGGERPVVQIAVSDREEFEFEGEIDFADNELDPETATNRLRAIVENEDNFLTPGLFARVRLPIGDPFDALLVPDAALGFDQTKRFAWVVGPDNTVTRRFVEVGALEGDQRIVKDGLTVQDQIVVSGIQLLRDGVQIEPISEGQGDQSGDEATSEASASDSPASDAAASDEPDASKTEDIADDE
ncbi:MAG: efflux RND transporter periplasmic adaptor subunit [Verrucomicrobiota bacterium]